MYNTDHFDFPVLSRVSMQSAIVFLSIQSISLSVCLSVCLSVRPSVQHYARFVSKRMDISSRFLDGLVAASF